ncbi:MAG: NHLP leader peptide family RiPP precursor [Gemmatimonadaceae bacterium]
MPNYDRIVAQITARAWSDPTFKARLLADPAAVMREHGLEVPADINVAMHENTAVNRHLVLPQMPLHFDRNRQPPAIGLPSIFRLDPLPRPPVRRGRKGGGGRKGGSKGRKGGSKGGGRKRGR